MVFIFLQNLMRSSSWSGEKLQMELQAVCEKLIRAVSVDLPVVIANSIAGRERHLTAFDYLNLSVEVTTFRREHIEIHANEVISLERTAARWRTEGPQSLYNAISHRTDLFVEECTEQGRRLLEGQRL